MHPFTVWLLLQPASLPTSGRAHLIKFVRTCDWWPIKPTVGLAAFLDAVKNVDRRLIPYISAAWSDYEHWCADTTAGQFEG